MLKATCGERIDSSGVIMSDEKALTDGQRIQTVTIATAIIYACRGKESMDEALIAAQEIYDRVVNVAK